MAHERLPVVSLRLLLTRFLDVTTPTSPALLKFLATFASDQEQKDRLTKLGTVIDFDRFSFPINTLLLVFVKAIKIFDIRN